jgi:hypothetical protein
MRTQNKTILALLLILLVSACSSAQPTEAPAPTTTIPTATETLVPPTETPMPTSTPVPLLERAQYKMDTLIDYDAHTVAVTETILYPNLTGNQLNTLVIAIVPNLWQDSFSLTSLSIDGAPTTTYSLAGQRLDIALSSFLPAGSSIEIGIQYTLALPFAEQEDPGVSRPRIYGYTSRQLNLTNWYPFVVPFINGE